MKNTIQNLCKSKLTLTIEMEELRSLGMRLYRRDIGGVVARDDIYTYSMEVKREQTHIACSPCGILQHITSTLIIVMLRYKHIYTPRICNGDIATALAGLGRASIAGGTEVDIGQETAHEGVLGEGLQELYSGGGNRIWSRLRGGIAEEETVFFPTIGLVSE